MFLAAAAAWAVCAAPAAAQAPNLALRVEPGQQYTATFVDRQSFEAGETKLNTTVRSVYALSIEGRDLWRWTPVSMEIVETSASENTPAAVTDVLTSAGMNDALSAMLRLTTDIGFLCRVDATGRCISLENWPQWRARVENLVIAFDAFARIGEAATKEDDAADEDDDEGKGDSHRRDAPARRTPTAGAGPDDGEDDDYSVNMPSFDWASNRGKVLQAVSAMIDSVDERAAASLLYTVMSPAGLQGRRLTTRGAEERTRESWALPFGAKPLELDATVTLASVDRAGNTATLRRRATLREDTVRAALRDTTDFMEREVIRPFAGESAPAGLAAMVESMTETLDFSVEEESEGVVDLSTGLARQVDSRYRIRVGAGKPLKPGERGESNAVSYEWRQTATISAGAPPTPRLERRGR